MIVNYRKLNILNVGGFMFKPGVNDYQDLDQNRLKQMSTEYPKVKQLLTDGTLEIVGSSDFDDFSNSPMVTDNRQSILGMKDRDAIALVKDTGDRELLNYWLGTVKSRNVETAIKEQIAAIDKAGETEKK